MRYIDTTLSPTRRLIPAGSAPRPALTSVTNTMTPPNLYNNIEDQEVDNDMDFGYPTTATTTTPTPPSHHPSRSPSPPANHAASDPLQVAGWKNGVAPTAGNKACASDYSDIVKRVILKACCRYEVFIVTENPFPEADTQLTKAQDYFAEACGAVGVDYQVTDRIIGIVSAVALVYLHHAN